MIKRTLTPHELSQVSGGSFSNGIWAAGYAISGLSVGGLIGAHLGEILSDTFMPATGYWTRAQNYFLDTAIAYHLGYFGINTKMSLFGCIGGSLFGSIAGSTLFGILI